MAARALIAMVLQPPSPTAVSLPSPASSSVFINSFHSNDELLIALSTEPTTLEWTLLIACGLLWTTTYLLLILTTHRTQLTGMPYFALALNITWEFLFTFITPHPSPQHAIDCLWFTLDCVILVQTLTYYPYHTPPLRLSYTAFLVGTAAVLVTSLALNWSWTVTLNDTVGAYSAFISNLFMSVSFVAMYVTRRPRGAGQCVWVGVCKLIGTGCSSVAFYMLSTRYNALLNVLFVSVFVWDVVYVVLLVQHWLQQSPAETGDEVQQHADVWRRSSADIVVSSHAVLAEQSASYSSGVWNQHEYQVMRQPS